MKNLILFTVIFFTTSLFSCKKNFNDRAIEEDSINSFAMKLGIHPNSIRDSGDYILVGGDMLFKKKDLLSTHKRQVLATPDNGVIVEGPISIENRGDIKVFINVETITYPQTVVDRYISAVRAAINNFNTLIPNTSIRFREIFTIGSADVIVHIDNYGPSLGGGAAWYPKNGKAGEHCYLNLHWEAGYPSVEFATLLTTHELGHTIGLYHTDQQPNPSYTESWLFGTYYLKQIPGTPGFASLVNPDPDPYSFILFNRYAFPGQQWSQSISIPSGIGFSTYDKIAISYLYPPSSSFKLSGISGYEVRFTNTMTGAETYMNEVYENGIVKPVLLPYGVYDIFVQDDNPNDQAQLILNNVSFLGSTFNLSSININTPTSFLMIQDTPWPCLFSAANDFEVLSSNMTYDAVQKVVEGYVAFTKPYESYFQITYANTPYLIATTPCNRPFEAHTFAFFEHGRTWNMSIHPNGEVWMSFSGSNFGPYTFPNITTFTFSYQF